MAYHFPSTISAARIATFVGTAAWIQGTSASEASLPEEALNNFLRRHGVGGTRVGPRQASASAPAAAPKDEEEEADSVSSGSSVSGDGVEEDGASSASSADSTPSEGAAGSSSSNPAVAGSNNNNNNADSAQAGITTTTTSSSGRPAIGSPDPPALSTGAKVAIGVWSAVAVVALAGLIYFFNRRRRARMAREEIDALREEELERSLAQSRRGMSEAGGFGAAGGGGGGGAGPPISAVAPSVYMRDSRGGLGVGDAGVGVGAGMAMGGMRGEVGDMGGASRAPSGQWMATPPWQDSAPTWRDSHPWRQSQPSVVGAQDRFPAGSRPPLPPFAPQNTKPEDDRRTEYTADTESTIFAYR